MVRTDQLGLGIAAQFAELGIDRGDPARPVGDGDDRGGVERLALEIGEIGKLLQLPALQQAAALQDSQFTVEPLAFRLANGAAPVPKFARIPLNRHRIFLHLALSSQRLAA